MKTKTIVGMTVVMVMVFFVMMGVMAHHEQDRKTSAQLDKEIIWMESHQVIVPRQ